MPGPLPLGSMAPPPPALTLVLTRIGSPVQLAVRIHDWTTACFDFGFNLHRGSPSINRCRPSELLHRF